MKTAPELEQSEEIQHLLSQPEDALFLPFSVVLATVKYTH
jgi:hypothetical protein